jgi:selT/selW/selH-like putative selenoprotein
LRAEGFEAKATPGTSGQFDVSRDGALVFSKREAKRFPEPGEVLSLLQG